MENPELIFIYNKKHIEIAKTAFSEEILNFTNCIRGVLFSIVVDRFRLINKDVNTIDNISSKYYTDILSIKIDKLKWAEYYSHFPKNKDLFFYAGRTFLELREEFIVLASKTEQEKDTILTIDEFELAFIEFLKERNFNTSE